LGGFLCVDAAEPVVAAVLLVPVVPDCWQDAKSVVPIRRAIREIRDLFIEVYVQFASRRVFGCLNPE
jgi:hypothetical protein